MNGPVHGEMIILRTRRGSVADPAPILLGLLLTHQYRLWINKRPAVCDVENHVKIIVKTIDCRYTANELAAAVGTIGAGRNR